MFDCRLRPDAAHVTYLSYRLQAACKLDLVHAVVHGFAVGGTFRHGALAASTAHTYAVDDVACLHKSRKFRYTDSRNKAHLN